MLLRNAVKALNTFFKLDLLFAVVFIERGNVEIKWLSTQLWKSLPAFLLHLKNISGVLNAENFFTPARFFRFQYKNELILKSFIIAKALS